MIATNNEGKLLEFENFSSGKVSLESFKSIGKKSPEEPHKTFLENALEKARYASLVTNLLNCRRLWFSGRLSWRSTGGEISSICKFSGKSVSKMKKI